MIEFIVIVPEREKSHTLIYSLDTMFCYRSKGPKTKGLVDTGPSDNRPSGQKAQLTNTKNILAL